MLLTIEAILLVIVIITAIIYVKKNKLFKLSYLVLGEAGILFLSAFIGYLLFTLTRNNIETNIKANMQEAFNNVDSYNYETEYVAELNNIALSGYTSGIEGKDLEDMYLQLEVYDSNRHLIYDSFDTNNVIFVYVYKINEEEEGIDELEDAIAYNLEDYFTKEQISELAEYYNDDDNLGFTYIYDIKGYYDESNQFILTEVDFNNQSNSNHPHYILGQANEDDLILEQGQNDNGYTYSFSAYLLDTDTKVINEAQEGAYTIDSCEYDESGFVGHSVAYWLSSRGIHYNIYNQNRTDRIVILNMYADTTSMTLKDTLFRVDLMCITVIFHCAALFAITIFGAYINKKRKLDQSRDTFINAMAHEMKTPVAVIQNTSEILKEGLFPEKQQHYLEINQEEAIHLNHLLMQMLTYTRTNESYKLKLEAVNLAQLVNDCLKHYEISQHLTVDIPEDTMIECDSSLMSVVIDNFISNAIRYSDSIISIQYTDHTFTIFNSGSSISKEDMKHIWEPLYKVESARTDLNSSGMGLAITANILELHQFQYGCHQKENGVEFYFSTAKSKKNKLKLFK